MSEEATPPLADLLPEGRSIVLVGLMGAGKSSIGRVLAHRLVLDNRARQTGIDRRAVLDALLQQIPLPQ